MTAPTVQRIHTERGSHIEPPLEQEWDNLTKLRWSLAVVLHDAGAPSDLVTVHEGNLTIGGERVESYQLHYRHGSAGGGDFHAMWSEINGIGLGLRLAKGLP